jgi:hypothetical protein
MLGFIEALPRYLDDFNLVFAAFLELGPAVDLDFASRAQPYPGFRQSYDLLLTGQHVATRSSLDPNDTTVADGQHVNEPEGVLPHAREGVPLLGDGYLVTGRLKELLRSLGR